jgi:hypothetical protein
LGGRYGTLAAGSRNPPVLVRGICQGPADTSRCNLRASRASARLGKSMLSVWTRAFGLIAVTALFANAQCYSTCALAVCNPAQSPSSACHHHKSSQPSHEDGPVCQHQHFEFAGPESGIAQVSVAAAPPILGVLTRGSAVVWIEPLLLSSPDNGSPPGEQVSSAISVLRI